LARDTDEAADDDPGFAGWALGAPLGLTLGLIAVIQIGTWAPHYLTWPYWADHDVFATAARAWDRGVLPYREFRCNNFPGAIYLSHALGKVGGWGNPVALYAFDAGLLVTVVGLLVAWSRRRFGRSVPGWVGSLAFLSYYLGLDYSHAAQRDWHASGFAVLALLMAQAWPGRFTGFGSATLTALALAFRPQAVVFLPALVLATWDRGAGQEGGESGRSVGRVAAWAAVVAVLVALAFLPLVVAGVFSDFLRSLRLVAYGSEYNRADLGSVARGWLLQAAALRWWVVPAGILLLGRRADPGARRTARPWLVAMAGASLYKPISPLAHTYLDLPLELAWSVNLATLAGLVASSPGTTAAVRLAAVLGLLGMGGTTLRPFFCVVGPNVRAVAAFRAGTRPEGTPPGYRRGTVPTSAYYPWADYRAALDHLRDHTGATTRVGNALKGDPAITSPADRPSAFPAESIAWLRMVHRQDEGAFVESLEKAGDSVVLWDPDGVSPTAGFRLDRLEAAIRRLYEREARFGAIEIWRRKAAAPAR